MFLCSLTPLCCCPCVPHVVASTCLTRMLCCSRRYFFVSCIRSGLKLYPALYNPPSFPIHGAGFPDPYAPSFQFQPQSVPSRVATPHRPLSSFQPSAAAGTWHSGLSPHSYYLVALPTNVKKCYGCGDMFAEKFRQAPHNIVVKHVDRRVVRRDDNTGALVYSTDFTNTYYHPNPTHIRGKNPVFDGRVLIDLGTYQSLDA